MLQRMHNDATQLLTTAQVAQLTSFHVSTIRRMANQGFLPVVRILMPGSKKPSLRFKPEAVEAWLAAQTTEGQSATEPAGASR